jgi:hypothetical protein
MHNQIASLIKTFKSYIPSNLKDRLFISKDGFREPIFSHIIAHSIFRFWIYPSYWRYLFTNILSNFGMWQLHQANIDKLSNNTRYLTGIPNPYAGIGHQLCNWNTAFIFASKYNLKFVHYPFTSKLKKSDWDKFLGFGEGELQYDEIIKNKLLKIVKLPRIWWNTDDKIGQDIVNKIINCTYLGSNILFHLDSDQSVYDYTVVQKEMRTKYWNTRNKNPINYEFKQDRLNIAVHIRRGDILKLNKNEKNFQERWLDNKYFINIINAIKNLLPEANIDIHIFSQGNSSDFKEFEKIDNVVYHLDEDEYQTFHSMIVADILLLSPSSFSYFTGLISKGLKIAKYPWLHEIPEDSEWIRSDKNGSFNPQVLIERFTKMSNKVKI